ncbi:MAG TPA: hypothetical protein VHW44_18440 [Pseudonocardiaceae bacterium]|jgi:hypothetical protein|nr:hypothetical protein [Pseudonocardiaceae bacterium]
MSFAPQAYPSPDRTPVRARPPAAVLASFWIFVLAAVAAAVGGVLVFADKQKLVTLLRDSNNKATTKLTDTQIQQAASVGAVVAIVTAIVVALLLLLLAFRLKSGRNWARVLITILAVLDVIAIFAERGTSTVGYIGGVAAVVGVVLAYLPKSNTYIREARLRS